MQRTTASHDSHGHIRNIQNIHAKPHYADMHSARNTKHVIDVFFFLKICNLEQSKV